MFSFEFVQLDLDVRHWVMVFDGDVIELSVVYHQTIFALVFLWNVEGRGCVGRASVLNESFGQFFG
jgi:hypothetical protein